MYQVSRTVNFYFELVCQVKLSLADCTTGHCQLKLACDYSACWAKNLGLFTSTLVQKIVPASIRPLSPNSPVQTSFTGHPWSCETSAPQSRPLRTPLLFKTTAAPTVTMVIIKVGKEWTKPVSYRIRALQRNFRSQRDHVQIHLTASMWRPGGDDPVFCFPPLYW